MTFGVSPFVDAGTVEWAIPAMLPDVDRHGENGILFLDEITSAAPSVSAAGLSVDSRPAARAVPRTRRVGHIRGGQTARGTVVWTYSMPAPAGQPVFLISRWTLIWMTGWPGPMPITLTTKIIAFFAFFDPTCCLISILHTTRSPSHRHVPGNLPTGPCKNSSDRPDLLTGALQACVGPAAGVELNAFIANLDQMPDLEAIVRGDDIAAPQENRFAVCGRPPRWLAHAIRAKQNGGCRSCARQYPETTQAGSRNVRWVS